MEQEHKWLVSQVDLESKYAGEYIAIVEESIIAHGRNLKKVLEAGRRGGKEPLIHKVPPHPDEKLMVV